MVSFNYIAKSVIAFSIANTGVSAASSCNPLSATGCAPDPALATDINVDFSSNSSYFTAVSTPSGISYGDNGVELTLAKRFDNPTIKSDFYIMFGRVEVHMKAAKGTGIVSSFYLQSDDLDEIDIELLGGDTTQFQSNFFSKGDTTTYDRGEYHNTPGSPQESYMNYTIVWTEESTTWYLNGDSVRTLMNNTSEGYPQSPMYIKAGIWAGGDPSNQPGTIEWAGGQTDYSDAPFSMYINKLLVSDYSTGSSYSYSDQSGAWTSIVAKDGKVNGRVNSAEEASSSANASPSSSSSAVSSSSSSAVSSSSSSAVSSSSSSAVSSSSSSSTKMSSSTSAQISSSSPSSKKSNDSSTSDDAVSALNVSTTKADPKTSTHDTLTTSTTSGSSVSTTGSSSSSPSVSTANSGSSFRFNTLLTILSVFSTYLI